MPDLTLAASPTPTSTASPLTPPTADAARNRHSGPVATAIQRALALPLLIPLLPVGLALNLFAWAKAYTLDGGVHGIAFRKTLPTHNVGRKLLSRVKVLNAVELEQRAVDPAAFEATFWAYAEANGFTRDEVAFEARAIPAGAVKQDVQRGLMGEDTDALIKLFLMHSPEHTVLCGLYDFGFLDGTSCLNFLQGLLAAYFDGDLPVNRPLAGTDLDLTLSESLRSKLGAGYALKVALVESWRFAAGFARWGLAREGYDLLIPPEISVALETLDVDENAAMVRALKDRAQPIKPFEHFLTTSARVLAEAGLPEDVRLLTQISCQPRYYEPILPRNQVGYWLISRNSRQTLTELQTVAFCRDYYRTLLDELRDFTGGVRASFVRQAMLSLGGTGNAANLREIFWFNNYGLRQMTPSAGPITYHWAPNYKMSPGALVNLVTLNGRTCITLSSSVIGQQALEEAARTLKQQLLETAADTPRSQHRVAS